MLRKACTVLSISIIQHPVFLKKFKGPKYLVSKRSWCVICCLFHLGHIVHGPEIGLIKWLRQKGLKVCSYVEKYVEFKNQTLKKINWYTKVLCAIEYPGVRNISK